jgi:hypothetical protein
MELSDQLALNREARIKEAIWLEIQAKAAEQNAATHAKEVSFRQEQETVTARAIERLQTEYANVLNINQMLRVIKLFKNKEDASIFLQLDGEIRDVWLEQLTEASE